MPWEPLGSDAIEEGHDVVTPGNYSSSKNLEKEVCGLQREFIRMFAVAENYY